MPDIGIKTYLITDGLILTNLKVNVATAPLKEINRTSTRFIKYNLELTYFTQKELDTFFDALRISATHGGDRLDSPIIAIIDESSVLLFCSCYPLF